ncbi:vanadium-dependent haloperoxidase, partial [bacterium]|nr:vanadium-dependent haloperoxidase [bacterium]
ALCRDINFSEYDNEPRIHEAASDLSKFTQSNAPTLNGVVNSSTIFRGNTVADLKGLYLSQFLLLDVPMTVPVTAGQHSVVGMNQLYQTLQPNFDFVTDYDSWLDCNNGGVVEQVPKYQNERRYIRNGRDLANAVHIDLPWQFAINAAYILLNRKILYDAGNPYKTSSKMDGFATFGYPHLMALIAEAGVRAGRAVWFQKWWVHRRLRPETFGGRIHNHLRGAANYTMIDKQILNSSVLQKIIHTNATQPLGRKATYLLPQVYPEGCQLHPAYASGHAAMIGAAVTILKAWFAETAEFTQPVTPNSQGTELVPYTKPDSNSLTVEGELNKLASNIAIGRMWAGIHWRSDATRGLELGEEVAIRLLKEQSITYAEPASFTLRRFNGTTEVIRPI